MSVSCHERKWTRRTSQHFCFSGRPRTINYLLGAQIGTSVRDAAWSFALPQSKGGTHDKSQTHRRGRSHFCCARWTRDGSARSSPPGTTKREHLLCDDRTGKSIQSRIRLRRLEQLA